MLAHQTHLDQHSPRIEGHGPDQETGPSPRIELLDLELLRQIPCRSPSMNALLARTLLHPGDLIRRNPSV